MEILLAIIGSGVLSTIISNIFSASQKKKEKEDGVREGVKLLLYSRIKELSKGYIDQGYIRYEELEDIIALHKCYHNDLGGNGYLDRVMNQVQNLKIVKE